jgi:hypothetical protein
MSHLPVRPLLAAVIALALSGCLSVKSYVDPELPKVGYADLLARRDPRPLHLGLEFQRQGKPHSDATAVAQKQALKVLQASRLFSAVETGKPENVDRLQIVLNNTGDMSDAAGKGIKTGLTFGAAGSMVTDHYTFTATFTPLGKPPVQKVYHHALHSTIGNAEGPKGLTPLGTQEAFDRVLEELVLNLLLDLQKEERLQ